MSYADAESAIYQYKHDRSRENKKMHEENENLKLLINYIYVKSFMEKVKNRLKETAGIGCHKVLPPSQTTQICLDQSDKDPDVFNSCISYLHHEDGHDLETCRYDIWCVHTDVWASLDLIRLENIFERSRMLLYEDGVDPDLDFIKKHYWRWREYNGCMMQYYLEKVMNDRPQIAEAVKQALIDLKLYTIV